MKKLKLTSNESYSFFNTASCITYDDILFDELHGIGINIGDEVEITFDDGTIENIKIQDIEYLDGTIWCISM